jgi:hypothetical protein
MQVMGASCSASSQTDRDAGAESRRDANTEMVEKVNRLSRDAKRAGFCRLFGESFLAKNLFGGFPKTAGSFWRFGVLR